MNDAHCSHAAGCTPKKEVFEELLPQMKNLIPSNIETTVRELKSLPEGLKYAFLGPKDTSLIVISTHLDENQQEVLLLVLRKHNGALDWNMANIKSMDPLV